MRNKDGFRIRIQEGASVIKHKISLPVIRSIHKGAPFCIRIEASYMAETAVALPFFVGFMAILLFFFQILTVQQEVGNAMLSAGRELSVLDCYADKELQGEYLFAKALIVKNLSKDSTTERFVKGGKTGISIAHSDFSGNYICLQADYQMQIPFGLFGSKKIRLTQRLKCRKWIGRRSGGDDDEIVYITKNGSVYHRNRDCSYIKLSVTSTNRSEISKLRNADGGKYYPCSKCMKNKSTDNMKVYITTYGNRYHSKKKCSEIKREVLAVHLSEVTQRRPCSKCGKE